jgi:hypothetical protein
LTLSSFCQSPVHLTQKCYVHPVSSPEGSQLPLSLPLQLWIFKPPRWGNVYLSSRIREPIASSTPWALCTFKCCALTVSLFVSHWAARTCLKLVSLTSTSLGGHTWMEWITNLIWGFSEGIILVKAENYCILLDGRHCPKHCLSLFLLL